MTGTETARARFTSRHHWTLNGHNDGAIQIIYSIHTLAITLELPSTGSALLMCTSQKVLV